MCLTDLIITGHEKMRGQREWRPRDIGRRVVYCVFNTVLAVLDTVLAVLDTMLTQC